MELAEVQMRAFLLKIAAVQRHFGKVDFFFFLIKTFIMREFELMDTVSFLCPPRMISQLTMLKSLEGMSCPISQARLVFLSQRNAAVFFIEV